MQTTAEPTNRVRTHQSKGGHKKPTSCRTRIQRRRECSIIGTASGRKKEKRSSARRKGNSRNEAQNTSKIAGGREKRAVTYENKIATTEAEKMELTEALDAVKKKNEMHEQV